MKKHGFYLALLMLAVFFAILSACGEGEPIDLADRGIEFNEVDKARNELRTIMDNCKGNPNQTICQPLSSGGESSGGSSGSNGSGGEPSGGSSSSGGEPSGGSSSSSSPPVGCSATPICVMRAESVTSGDQIQPTPTVRCGINGPDIPANQVTWTPANLTFTETGMKTVYAQVANNPPVACTPGITVVAPPQNSYPDFNFTCSWTPNSVIAGDSAKVNIAITGSTPKLETDCNKKEAWYPMGLNLPDPDHRDTAYFEVGANVQTSGKIIGKRNQETPSAWLATDSFPSPLSGSSAFLVKGTLTCKDNDHIARSKTVDCAALTLNAPPSPSASSGTITFRDSSYSPNIYFIGSRLRFTHNIANITNNSAAKCDTIMTKISGGGLNDSAKHAMSVSQTAIPSVAQTMTASKVFATVTADQSITASVIAICRGKQYTLATNATAKVVPNPSLSGSCTWSSDLATVGSPIHPQGVSILNEYNRCSGGVTYSGGVLGSVTWPLTITEAHYNQFGVGTPPSGITGVTANANCSSGNFSANCPKLLFNYFDVGEEDNKGNCGYQWSWCNGWPVEIVKKNFNRTNTLTNACVYVRNVTRLAAATYYINNTSIVSSGENNNLPTLPAKVDSGYYIWIPSGVAIDGNNKFQVTHGNLGCSPGTPTNAVAVCKSWCGDRADRAVSETLQSGSAAQPRPYELKVYGNENCTNLRWRTTSGTQSNTTCSFIVNKTTTVNVSGNSNIASVNRSTWGSTVQTTIEYRGGSGCPSEIKLMCD